MEMLDQPLFACLQELFSKFGVETKFMLEGLIHDILFDVFPVGPVLKLPPQIEGLGRISGLNDLFFFRFSLKFLTLIIVLGCGVLDFSNLEGCGVEVAHPSVGVFGFAVLDAI